MLKMFALLGLLTLSAPHNQFGPSNVTIKVRVKDIPKAAGIDVVVDGEDYYRESGQQLNDGQSLYLFEFRNVPPGNYVVAVGIGDRDGHILQQTETGMTIIGPEGQ